MVDGTTAHDRLQRLLHVLPAAARDGGASVDDLAETLGTSPGRILEDLRAVTDRVFYHPGGWPDDVRILLDGARVRVIHAGGLDRPVRLNPRELLCLAMALRGGAAAGHLPGEDGRAALLRRAEEALCSRSGDAAVSPPVEVPDRAPDPEALRETVLAATRARSPLGIVYLKSGADDAEGRLVHPYRVAYADGSWYVLAWCTVAEGVRVFRIDRILEAAPADGSFEVPADFDPAPFFDGGKVYHAPDDEVVRVRYSPKVARWVRERAEYREAELEEDGRGGVILRHRVADPGWVVSHALQYGAEAEILDPPEMRALVREVVGRMAG